MHMKEKRTKILIVDDEKVNIDVLVGLLKPYYQTVSAKNGEQAIKRLTKKPLPDLILLDIMMPGMNGYEVCRKIKSDPSCRDIPVIFITVKDDEQDEAKGFDAGAADYITKPFRPLIVLARVRAHIEIKKRGDMLEELAGLDGLTGIPNRRQFDQFLDVEWKRSLRYRHRISLILTDVDFFKLYNDHYGHAQGDECLRKVARAFSHSITRSADIAARYGGEEFACILPETGNEGALALANRLMENIRALRISHAQSRVADHVTISIGIATLVPTLKDRAQELLEMADKALYQAKQKGRNQIVSHP